MCTIFDSGQNVCSAWPHTTTFIIDETKNIIIAFRGISIGKRFYVVWQHTWIACGNFRSRYIFWGHDNGIFWTIMIGSKPFSVSENGKTNQSCTNISVTNQSSYKKLTKRTQHQSINHSSMVHQSNQINQTPGNQRQMTPGVRRRRPRGRSFTITKNDNYASRFIDDDCCRAGP